MARSFISKTKYIENISPYEDARYLFYIGKIEAIQMNYSDSYTHLSSSFRKAPEKTAQGFKTLVSKFLILVPLLHDLCKANFYTEGTKNQKTYDSEKVASAESWQVKSDAQGKYIWETVKTYQVDDQLPLGHGEKSVMLAQCYIRLTMQEVMAIRWHMGFSEANENWNTLGNAMEKYPIILAIHEADLEATKILEVE